MQRRAQDVNKPKHCQKVKKIIERLSDEQEVMSFHSQTKFIIRAYDNRRALELLYHNWTFAC